MWFVLLPIVAVLLLVTIVGIPLGLFLLFGLGLVYSIGYVVGGLALGRLAREGADLSYLAFLAGWGALRVLALVPFLGGIAWLVGTVLGLGTLWVAARAPSGDRTVRVPESPSAERERSRLAAQIRLLCAPGLMSPQALSCAARTPPGDLAPSEPLGQDVASASVAPVFDVTVATVSRPAVAHHHPAHVKTQRP